MRPLPSPLCLLPALFAAVLGAAANASEPVDYQRQVKPLLRERCSACHGPLKQKGKLRLDTAGAIRQGGRSGPAVVPGKPAESLLLDAVTGNNHERMPPEGEGSALGAEQVALLRAWVAQGAAGPADEKPTEDPRRHWAFQPVRRPVVPAMTNSQSVRNPIDAFVAAERHKRGLTPLPEADQATLLRRLTLDLTGLPPTRAEVQAYLADNSPTAYEKVVDRLLASPHYAERWARHWMDVWRYSDWYGSRYINELRNSRRHIWRWRDWIIDSLEADKGYDRMVQEMLAGDELAPGDADVQRATGYLGRNFYVFNRNVWLQDTVEYVGSGLLGLTLKCCRCHDHKYDPLTQQDYYRFRAFFEPHRVRTDPLPGKRELLKTNLASGSPPGSDLKEGLDCVYDAEPDAVTCWSAATRRTR
jgi:mono/diheme cytochrome c family protein